MHNREKIATFCALCVSRCGALATVRDAQFVALEPDPSHPTGQALCLKGRVAPELVYHPERLLHPLKRTNPKTSSDPGWQQISWEEALATTAERLLHLKQKHGAETVVFTTASPSTSAISDSIDWIMRLRRAFGSPNMFVSMELCGWGRYFASSYTFGNSVPGIYMPDLERAGCILFWGYNPSVARIAHATATVAATNRGAKLIVVDPRQAGLARRADQWLRVRPGTDGALALAIANMMIERGWYDVQFVREWTNGPLLVRSDTGRLLRERDLVGSGDTEKYVAWSSKGNRLLLCDARDGSCEGSASDLALSGEFSVRTTEGTVSCRPAFDLLSELCARYDAVTAEAITGVPAKQIDATARLLWQARPVAFYTWSGVEQHTNVTQAVRAIGLLYALTGSLDVPGGNVLFPSVPSNPIGGYELLPAEARSKALGLAERPLGPSRWEFVTSDEAYTAALEGNPYRIRGMVGFGANLLMANADSGRGRRALAELDFYVHADLFITPTAEMADIVLPVASAFETEGLMIGFQVSAEAQSLVQLRAPLVTPRGEARSDIQIVFELARRLGLGEHFWDGDIDAGYRHQLAPSGVSLEQLREEPAGIRVPLETRYRKFAGPTQFLPIGIQAAIVKLEQHRAHIVTPE